MYGRPERFRFPGSWRSPHSFPRSLLRSAACKPAKGEFISVNDMRKAVGFRALDDILYNVGVKLVKSMRRVAFAARFADSDDMSAGNPNSFARRIGLWAFAAFSMLLALAGRGSAAPGCSWQAASHFTIARFGGGKRPEFPSVHSCHSRRQGPPSFIPFRFHAYSTPTSIS